MGKGTKLYRFVCKTGSWTATKNHPECTKTYHIETRKQFFFCGGGTPPSQTLVGRGTSLPPLTTPTPFGSSSQWNAHWPPPTALCTSKLTLKKPCPSQLTKGPGGASRGPPTESGADPRPETHFGVFWRPQNAPLCTCMLKYLGQGRYLGGNSPPAPT